VTKSPTCSLQYCSVCQPEPFPCDCKQGTEENGWHETVGPMCYERELGKWRKVNEWLKSEEYREMVDELRAHEADRIRESLESIYDRIEELQEELWILETEAENLEMLEETYK